MARTCASLGMEIRLNRISNKLSQRELAKNVGISSQYLCDIEADRKIPGYPLAKRFQDFFPAASILKYYNSIV